MMLDIARSRPEYAPRQVSQRVDIQPLQGLAAANRQFQVGHALAEDFRRDISRHRRSAPYSSRRGGLGVLSEAKALLGQKRLDLVQAGFAEILIA